MREILIYDRFMVGKTSTSYGINDPLHFRWVHLEDQFGQPYLIDTVPHDICVYTEHMIHMPDKIGKVKIGWMIEPEEYIPGAYEWIKENYDEFDYIFTWNKELLSISKKFIFLNPGGSWITREEAEIFPKNKLCSMIASDKEFMSGHKIRRQVFEQFKNRFDRYGRDTVPLLNIIDAYKDYMFTVVVENVKQDYMFSEKLTTPILCGTIPIYYGCPSLVNFLDIRGIIPFNEIEELPSILDSITEDKYMVMLPYVKENFKLAKKYQLLEDSLYYKLVELKLIS